MKTCNIPQNLLSRYLTMRTILLLSSVLALSAQPVFAQGVKDPPNYPRATTQNTKKTQTTSDASRPTAIRNIATGKLPAGMAAQGVYKDGKLTAIPRY